MYCRKCGRPIEDNSSFCKYCGSPQYLNANIAPKKDTNFWLPIVSICLSGLASILYVSILAAIDIKTIRGIYHSDNDWLPPFRSFIPEGFLIMLCLVTIGASACMLLSWFNYKQTRWLNILATVLVCFIVLLLLLLLVDPSAIRLGHIIW